MAPVSSIFKTCVSLFVLLMSMESRNRQIANQWALIKDIIGPASLWPTRIRVLFWTRNLTHFQRFLLACFVFVNGLSPEDFMHWSDLMHLCRNTSAREHLLQLFQRFERGEYGGNYYAFNVSNRRYEYLNGTVRHYTPANERN